MLLTAALPSKEASAAPAGKLAAFEADLDRERQLAAMVCSLENKEACLSCGS